MPTKYQLKIAFDRLVAYISSGDPRQGELVRAIAVALEERLRAVNSEDAVTIARIENELRDELARLRQDITVLHHALINEIKANREQASAKSHQLSNHVMGLENKVDELAQLVMLQNPYDE